MSLSSRKLIGGIAYSLISMVASPAFAQSQYGRCEHAYLNARHECYYRYSSNLWCYQQADAAYYNCQRENGCVRGE